MLDDVDMPSLKIIFALTHIFFKCKKSWGLNPQLKFFMKNHEILWCDVVVSFKKQRKNYTIEKVSILISIRTLLGHSTESPCFCHWGDRKVDLHIVCFWRKLLKLKVIENGNLLNLEKIFQKKN